MGHGCGNLERDVYGVLCLLAKTSFPRPRDRRGGVPNRGREAETRIMVKHGLFKRHPSAHGEMKTKGEMVDLIQQE